MPSPSDRREKLVELTPRAAEYLETQRAAALRIERELRQQVGDAAFDGLYRLVDALEGHDQPRMSEYLRSRLRDL